MESLSSNSNREFSKIQLNHLHYRPDIDGLRAIAVLAVTLFHAFPQSLPGGFVGVDVFFVISGFLISSIIFRKLSENNFSFKEFYIRRINRIFPALLIILISCLVFGYFTLFPDEYQQLSKHSTGASVFLANVVLWIESGYFDTSSAIKPLLHLWSLGVEEQFYIIWPLLLFAIWKFNTKPLIILFGLFFISVIWEIAHITVDPVANFYLFHARAWELIIGGILAYYTLYGKALFTTYTEYLIKQTLSIIGIFLLGYSFYTITDEVVFPGWIALLPVLSSLLIIASGPNTWINKFILSNKVFVWFGLISYPLYLWHWPILSFLRIIKGGTPDITTRILAIGLAIILAALTFHVFEKPLKRITHGIKTLFLIIAMMFTCLISYFIYISDGLPLRSSIKDSMEVNAQFVGPIWQYTQNDLCLNKYPLSEAKSYAWWFCIVNKDSDPTILLLGNSYANHLYPGLIKNDYLREQTILSIGTCNIDTADTNAEGWSPCSGEQAGIQKTFIKSIINKSPSIKYVIISGLSIKQNEQTIARVKAFLSFLTAKDIKPIIFIPHITVPYDLKRCFARPFSSPVSNCELDITERQKINQGFSPLIKEIAKDYPQTLFFDQNQLFCNSHSCHLLLNGMPIFRDEYSHYSEYASEQLIKLFINWLQTNPTNLSNE